MAGKGSVEIRGYEYAGVGIVGMAMLMMMMVMEDWDGCRNGRLVAGPAKTEPADLARKLHLESVTGKKKNET